MVATKKKKARTPKKLVPTNVRMDDEMLDELRQHAALEARTVSNMIYWITREWLDANRGKISNQVIATR